jgi:outer membrane PBP1 activator LpoA protein
VPHFGHAGKRFALTTLSSILLLAGCGSTPKQSEAPRIATPKAIERPTDTGLTPEHKLVEAKEIWAKTRNKVRRDELLLNAAELYLSQDKPILAQQILFEVKQDGIPNELESYYALLMVKAYVDTPSTSIDDLLAMLERVAENQDTVAEKATLQAYLFSKKGNYAAAANSTLKTDLPDEEKVRNVWEWITSVPSQELSQIGKQYSALSPFITLRQLTEQYAASPQEFNNNLAQFRQVYRGHVVTNALPQEVLDAATISDAGANDIAVLLPLSGRLARTGDVVKNGIMAAYYADVDAKQNERALPRLRFIDTNNADTDYLLEQIGDTKFILGPLLKETVEQLIPALPVGVNVLALNRFETTEEPGKLDSMQQDNELSTPNDNASELTQLGLPTSLNYFGLAPEDEAKQLADYIFSKGYRAPIVIAAQSNLYQRMDATFKQQWRALNNKENKQRANITSVTFNDSGSLREGITQALDVAQSNERINQIEYMTNDEVYNLPRSRRDIDAIVAFASPQDTELLNPIIEASLNPYDAKQVPVYATSRSMDYDSGKNQWRDLQNVHFIDMPWLMPEHNWKALESEVTTAWENQNTMQKRLFAFGYDAYQLLPELGMLNTLNYLTHDGLTGTLSVNDKGEVIRKQPQAIIRNEEVQMLME